MVRAEKIKERKRAREAMRVAKAKRGSKWKKISTRPM